MISPELAKSIVTTMNGRSFRPAVTLFVVGLVIGILYPDEDLRPSAVIIRNELVQAIVASLPMFIDHMECN